MDKIVRAESGFNKPLRQRARDLRTDSLTGLRKQITDTKNSITKTGIVDILVPYCPPSKPPITVDKPPYCPPLEPPTPPDCDLPPSYSTMMTGEEDAGKPGCEPPSFKEPIYSTMQVGEEDAGKPGCEPPEFKKPINSFQEKFKGELSPSAKIESRINKHKL